MQERKKPFKVSILTLYPESFPGYLGLALAGKALANNIWSLDIINIRDFALDNYKKVDDKSFGGGKGLILKADVLGRAIDFALEKGASPKIIYPSPQGKIFNQKKAKDLSLKEGLTFICGHFEGIDARVIEKYNIEEVSIGDYILSGGEISSMVIVDSILRFLPNVIKSFECVEEESFSNNLLEYPQYTKPALWQNIEVPKVLLSGNHQEIEQWRKKKSEEKTKSIRPDLWKKYINEN